MSVYVYVILNPLHPNISMHILHTILYIIPKVLTRRDLFIDQEKIETETLENTLCFPISVLNFTICMLI